MRVIFLYIDGVLNCSKKPPRLALRRRKKAPADLQARCNADARESCFNSDGHLHDPAGLFSARYRGMGGAILFPICPSNPVVSKFAFGLRSIRRLRAMREIDDDDDELDDSPFFQPSAAKGLTPKYCQWCHQISAGENRIRI